MRASPATARRGRGRHVTSRETPHTGIQYRGRRVWVGVAETDLCYKTSAERIANDARNEEPNLALLPLIRRRSDGLLCVWGGEGGRIGGEDEEDKEKEEGR